MKRLFIKDQRGQALVELALVLPVLLVLFMGTVEFGRIFHSYLVITNASREGARVAVLGGTDTAISNRVGQVTGSLDSARLQTTVTPVPADRKSGALATVEVRYQVNLVFPLFDVFIPDPLPIRSSTTMRVE
ncbi:MAG: TadE/TadG family type IV pilus assembly protein [Bacillota bacterium]